MELFTRDMPHYGRITMLPLRRWCDKQIRHDRTPYIGQAKTVPIWFSQDSQQDRSLVLLNLLAAPVSSQLTTLNISGDQNAKTLRYFMKTIGGYPCISCGVLQICDKSQGTHSVVAEEVNYGGSTVEAALERVGPWDNSAKVSCVI